MTAKKDIALTIAYEAKSDWASGYLRAVVIDEAGNRRQISDTAIASGTADKPVVDKEIVAHLRAGDSLLFYFGNDTADVQTIYFTAQFTADPNAFDAQQIPQTGYNTLLLGFAFYPPGGRFWDSARRRQDQENPLMRKFWRMAQ